ncbi:hypothetical protein GP486_002242 [Trichoglossum hirsutum]|uniref:RraA-like protein n=1 Tax=Trichoglossum hirsutum TaxID=265104 RepID=A0A9P8RRW5_9PEZI|nr:hypothetical protein GP486_002242 [Trichoglossum hirsutum]
MYSPQFQSGAARIAGPAFTVKFVPKDDIIHPKPAGHYSGLRALLQEIAHSFSSQIDQVPKDSVIFISQPRPHINAVFGGLMALRAHKLGTAGVVIDGRLRDLQDHRALGLPVFARAVGTTAGGAVCRPSEVNVPIRFSSEIQEAWIRPGDFIIADLNGVVSLPKELAEPVLDIIPRIVEADRKCADSIEQGRSVEEVFKEFRT